MGTRPGEALPEDRFHEPSARCPHPSRWHSTDGDSTEVEVSELVGALARALQPDLVVELGAAWGQTTEQLARALDRNGRGELYALEIDTERAAYTRDRLAELKIPGPRARWYVRMESSLEWTPPGPVDLLFSDTHPSIRVQELLRFHARMPGGAIAVVHDSAYDKGGLRGWIENLLVRPGLFAAVDLPTPRGLTVLERLHEVRPW